MKTLLYYVFLILSVIATTTKAACGSCSDACSITIPTMITGSTVDQPYSNVSCQYTQNSKGSWYQVIGTGQTLQVDTCDDRNNFDTVIMIFDSCTQTGGRYTSCVAMDDDSCGGGHSKITFTAEKLHYYYIFVTGYQDSEGVYYLEVAEPTAPTASQCQNAIGITSFPYVSDSDTSTSTAVTDTCLSTTSAGMWYHITGSGEAFVAHLCSLNTRFDTVLQLYNNCSEDGTGGGECLTYNDDYCYKQSMVSWRSVMNSEYWLFVTGHANERGIYSLVVEQASLKPNSKCSQPIEIVTFPFVYSGTTEYLDDSWSECTQRNRNGKWFRMHGLTRMVIASTCSDDNFQGDSAIDVYTSCDDATGQASQCVGTNDDYCGQNAAVIFDSFGPTFYIFVYGYTSGIAGINFTLSVTPYEDANNSQCWYGKQIHSLPMDFSGNTRDSEVCKAGCDGSSAERKGAWFRYVHFGEPTVVTATTCNRQNIMPSKLEVYNDCQVMSCCAEAAYDTKTNCSTATFAVENGKTYNTLVTADDLGNPGSYYHVDFFEQVPSNHSQCSNADTADSLPFRTEQYTGLAKPSWSGCSGRNKQGYWVKLIGDGNKLVASTCDAQTEFDTVLELYDACPSEGSTESHCLASNDDDPACGLASRLDFDTDKGAVYWLFVTGHSESTGIFVLNVYHMESPENWQCLTSKGISTLPYIDYGLTTYAQLSNGSCEYGMRKGLWYTVVGDNYWLEVETCGEETTFETEIEVYMDCDKQGGKVCLNHNHDSKCAPQTAISFPAIRGVIYWLYITGVHTDVMAEGFFKLTVAPGKPITPEPLSSFSDTPGGDGGLSPGVIVIIVFGSLATVGAFIGAGVAVFAMYKRRHIDYVHIDGTDSAPVNTASGDHF